MAEPTSRRTETHQRILDAAGRLFRQNGIDGVGVDAVMKQAGLTHGGFYAHFASKEALAAEVAQTLLEKAARSWDEISRTDDPDSALRRIVLAYLNPENIASGLGCPLTSLGPDVARRSASRSAVVGALRGMLGALTRVMPEDDAGCCHHASLAGSFGPPVVARAGGRGLDGSDQDRKATTERPAKSVTIPSPLGRGANPGSRRDRALAALSTMVGAVVLARLAEDPGLAQEFLDAAAAGILPDRTNTPG